MGFYGDHIFPRILDFCMGMKDLEPLRTRVLSECKGEGLEIGFGTGMNLPHYPVTVHRLFVVENHPRILQRAAERIRKVKFSVEAKLEDAAKSTFPPGTLDFAVSTFSLCSIARPEETLKKVREALKPGAKLYFLEHGLSPDASVAKWQNRLNGFQNKVACGCNLNRDMAKILTESGFAVEEMENSYLPGAPKALGYIYLGSARAAAR